MNPANELRGYATAGRWEQTAGDYFEDEAETAQRSSRSGAPVSPAWSRSRSRERAPAARAREYEDAYATLPTSAIASRRSNSFFISNLLSNPLYELFAPLN